VCLVLLVSQGDQDESMPEVTGHDKRLDLPLETGAMDLNEASMVSVRWRRDSFGDRRQE
jgi:hypothetical protein